MRYLSYIIVILLLALNVNSTTIDFDLTKQESGIISGNEGTMLTLTVDGKSLIKMEFTRLGDKRVMLTLINSNEYIILDVDVGKAVDFDDNKIDDASMMLTSIIDGKATIKIKKIGVIESVETPEVTEETPVEEAKEEVTEEIEEETIVETPEETIEEVSEETTEEKIVPVKEITEEETTKEGAEITGAATGVISSNLERYGKWLLGGIIVVVLIVIIVFVYRGGENTERLYGKATDLHREGQEFHFDGDDETAEELYQKANEVRTKARNLEGGS